MVYPYVENGRKRCQVDVLVYTLDMSHYRVNLSSDGEVLSVKTVVPSFFYNLERLNQANKDKDGYSENTHRAIACARSLRMMEHEANESDEVYAEPMKVKVPFKCDPDEY